VNMSALDRKADIRDRSPPLPKSQFAEFLEAVGGLNAYKPRARYFLCLNMAKIRTTTSGTLHVTEMSGEE